MRRWLSTARKIIQRYKLNSKQKVRSKFNSKHFPIIDPNTNLHVPTKQIPHTIIKAKQKNHLKEYSITKYYKSTATITNHTIPIPSKPNNKIASGTLYNNAVLTNTIPTSYVVPQDSFHKHNIHHDISSQHPSELRIPKISINESSEETERQKLKKIIPTLPNPKVHSAQTNNSNRDTCSVTNSIQKQTTLFSKH